MAQKLYDTVEQQKRAFLISLGKEGDKGKELRGLAETLELAVASHEIINVRKRQPKFGMGTGKAAELAEKAAAARADCIVFDWDVSPSQQRNWEELSGIPVLDRQELIIQIFSARAATFFSPVKMLRIFPYRAQKNVIYRRNVICHYAKICNNLFLIYLEIN